MKKACKHQCLQAFGSFSDLSSFSGGRPVVGRARQKSNLFVPELLEILKYSGLQYTLIYQQESQKSQAFHAFLLFLGLLIAYQSIVHG